MCSLNVFSKAYQRFKPTKRKYSPGNSFLFLCILHFFCVAEFHRLDLYDAQGNHLQFVTFEYDQTGKCISRSVFMSDSTFTHRTQLIYDPQGKVSREISFNFNDDTVMTCDLSYGDKTTFNTKDQFKLLTFGAPLSVSGSSPEYEILQGSNTLNKLSYIQQDNMVSRVDVKSPSGEQLFFGQFRYPETPVKHNPNRKTIQPAISGTSHNRVEYQLELQRKSFVKCELITLSGRHIKNLLNRELPKGTHKGSVRLDHPNFRMAAGMYLLNLTVNGTSVAQSRFLQQRGYNSSRTNITTRYAPVNQNIKAENISFDPSTSAAPPSFIFEALAINRDLSTPNKPKYLSPSELSVSPDKKTLYVAEQTGKTISLVNVLENRVIKRISLPNEPTGIVLSREGSKALVTCASDRWPAGIVAVVNLDGGSVESRIPVGHGARSPVISPDGSTLYVCNFFDNDISVIDIAAGKETRRIPVIREPYIARLTPDGTVLVVANSLPDQKATDDPPVSCQVSLISTSDNTINTSLHLFDGSHSTFGLAISPDGKYAFISHLVAKYTIPATRIDFGWVHTNNISIVDIKAQKVINSICLDRSSRGFGNPWGLVCSEEGKHLCVAHAGSNEISIIDLPYFISKAQEPKDHSSDFSVLINTTANVRRKEIPVSVKNPRALAVVDDILYTAGYFSDSLEYFNLDLTSTSSPLGKIALGPHQPMTTERIGESYFYDAKICLQNWQSCHSCHPFTRPDALNWVLGGGNNTPKNAKSMLYSWWTPPTQWSGRVRTHAQESIRAGIQVELFRHPEEWIAVPLDTFFMNMRAVPSPNLVKGRLSEAAQRGKNLYYQGKIDCRYCHGGPLFTDNLWHNAGVIDPYDVNNQWVTPNLIEAWRTAPYGHIGSYEKIEDIMKLPNHSNAGEVLSSDEFNDLVQYILSL